MGRGVGRVEIGERCKRPQVRKLGEMTNFKRSRGEGLVGFPQCVGVKLKLVVAHNWS